jgi:trans-aconitate methyltransferase
MDQGFSSLGIDYRAFLKNNLSPQENLHVKLRFMDTRKGYVKRIQSYYERSDEKPRVQELLRNIFRGMRFPASLDVGGGTGELTKVLDELSDHLTAVEIESEFAQKLREKFPNANVVQASLEDFEVESKYDLIFVSHVLYYIPCEKWLTTVQKIIGNLSPSGKLVLILNTDEGDWWQTISHFKPKLKEDSAFYYKRWSEFKLELSKIADINSVVPYSYEVSYKDLNDLVEYIGRSCLAIHNEKALEKIRPEIEKFCLDQLKATNSLGALNYAAELLILTGKLTS